MIDDYNRECLNIEVGHSLPVQRVIKLLEQLIEWRGKPKAIRCDNGPEYIYHALREWAQSMDIELMYIQPGKPTQWMWVYNNERPHSSIGGIPPRKLLEAI